MTWSIVARDRDSGALGSMVATKFVAAAGLCLNVAGRVGALSTQAAINPTYGPRGLQLLREGHDAQHVVDSLVGGDRGGAHRQVHVVDSCGSVAAHTGAECGDWSGHRTGRGVSVAGNMLAGPQVVDATIEAYEALHASPFVERLMEAMCAGQSAGGDQRGQQSAGILVFGAEDYPDLSLRVDEHRTPLEELKRIYELWLLDFAAARKYMATRADPVGVYDSDVIEAELQARLAEPRNRIFPV